MVNRKNTGVDKDVDGGMEYIFVNFFDYGKSPPCTTQMTKIMIALDSSFLEDQNLPKYHPIQLNRIWVMNYFIHTCIMEWVGPKNMNNCLG